jgi:ABC transporter substrate binding protein
LTGVSIMATELVSKRLELISELVPKTGVIALLVNPNNPGTEAMIRDVQEAARGKGVQLHILKAGTESVIGTAFATLVQLHAGALLVGNDPFFFSRREALVALASRHAVPAIYEWREFPELGGLISYGPSLTGVYRQLGIYDSGRPRDQYRTGGVDPLPTVVASPTDDRIDQRSVIRAGLLVMLTTGSHQLVGSSHGLGGGIGPLILIVGGRG